MLQELNRQSEQYKSQPPKLVFNQHSKLSQFVAPLLAGNSKTWLFGCLDPERALDENKKMLDALLKHLFCI